MKYFLVLFCLFAVPAAFSEENPSGNYEVDNQRINVPAPEGFVNIIGTPQGKKFAAGFSQNSEVLAFFVPEKADIDKMSLESGIKRYMMLKVARHLQLRARMPLLQFIELQKSIKSFAAKDNAFVIYETPRAIATMKLFTDAPLPYVSVGATVLIPQMPITLQVRSSLEGENDKEWVTVAVKNWIEGITKGNPWTR